MGIEFKLWNTDSDDMQSSYGQFTNTIIVIVIILIQDSHNMFLISPALF